MRHAPPFGESGLLAQDHLKQAAQALRALDLTVEPRIVTATGAAEGILAYCRSGDHDVVVLGGHGPQQTSLFGINDVTSQVLQGADRPVLVVSAEE